MGKLKDTWKKSQQKEEDLDSEEEDLARNDLDGEQ